MLLPYTKVLYNICIVQMYALSGKRPILFFSAKGVGQGSVMRRVSVAMLMFGGRVAAVAAWVPMSWLRWVR